MNNTNSYTHRDLELRAAEYYASIRKPEQEWRSITDLTPQLAEFEHLVQAGDYDHACQVLESIDQNYLYLWGYYMRLLELRTRLSANLGVDTLQALNLNGIGQVHRALGQFKQAQECKQAGLRIAQRIGDRRLEGQFIGNIGSIYHITGEVDKAKGQYETALVIAEEFHDIDQQVGLMTNLGYVYRAQGQLEKAQDQFIAALNLSRKVGRRDLEVENLKGLGSIQALRDDVEHALDFHNQALAIARAASFRKHESVQLSLMADLCLIEGRAEEAIENRRNGLAIAREIRHKYVKGYHLQGLGKAYLVTGQLSDAITHCREALTLDLPKVDWRASAILGTALFQQQNYAEARITFQQAEIQCRHILTKTPNLFEPLYTLPFVLVGQAVCDSNWKEPQRRRQLLAPALTEYVNARHGFPAHAPGMIRIALRDLNLLCTAGKDGLALVFKWLEGVLHESS
jgi:tetratricopeptide (TPR) repeat protein